MSYGKIYATTLRRSSPSDSLYLEGSPGTSAIFWTWKPCWFRWKGISRTRAARRLPGHYSHA